MPLMVNILPTLAQIVRWLAILIVLCIVVGVAIGLVVGIADWGSGKESTQQCLRVARDAFHFPEEYQPGSYNHARLSQLGVQPHNIGTLGPAMEDCNN